MRRLYAAASVVCLSIALILSTLILTYAPFTPPPTLATFVSYWRGMPFTDTMQRTLTEYSDSYLMQHERHSWLYYVGTVDGWNLYVTARTGVITYAGMYCVKACTLTMADLLALFGRPSRVKVAKYTCLYTWGVAISASARCGGYARAHDWRTLVSSIRFR